MTAKISFLALLCLALGCTKAKPANRCVAGLSVDCSCSAGTKGSQVCNSEGSFEPCVCQPVALGENAIQAPAATRPQVDETQSDDALPAEASSWEVSDDQFGPLTKDMKVSKASLVAAVKGAKIKESTRASEGEEWPVYEIHLGKEVITVTPDKATLLAVSTTSSLPRLAHGIGQGSSYELLRQQLGKLHCMGGMHESAEQILCKILKTPSVLVAFDIGNADYYMENEIPSEEVDRLLKGKTIAELTWTPQPL